MVMLVLFWRGYLMYWLYQMKLIDPKFVRYYLVLLGVGRYWEVVFIIVRYHQVLSSIAKNCHII
jgi:hypothetical protein